MYTIIGDEVEIWLRQVAYFTKFVERSDAITSEIRKTYMDYWHFTDEEKDDLVRKLTKELPALRGAAKASQDEIAKAIGVSRQTYNSIEMQKRKMSWNTYMSLILFFDYNPSTHYTIRQLDAFPYRLDECWLSGKMDQANGE